MNNAPPLYNQGISAKALQNQLSQLQHTQECVSKRVPQIESAFNALEESVSRQTELVNQLLVRIEPIRLQSLPGLSGGLSDAKSDCPKPPTAPMAGRLESLIREVEILSSAISHALGQIEL